MTKRQKGGVHYCHLSIHWMSSCRHRRVLRTTHRSIPKNGDKEGERRERSPEDIREGKEKREDRVGERNPVILYYLCCTLGLFRCLRTYLDTLTLRHLDTYKIIFIDNILIICILYYSYYSSPYTIAMPLLFLFLCILLSYLAQSSLHPDVVSCQPLTCPRVGARKLIPTYTLLLSLSRVK